MDEEQYEERRYQRLCDGCLGILDQEDDDSVDDFKNLCQAVSKGAQTIEGVIKKIAEHSTPKKDKGKKHSTPKKDEGKDDGGNDN